MHAAKYSKAVECLRKDRETLLAFYDFHAKKGPSNDDRVAA
ncbi:MAG: hypothetical protein WC824_04130 [Bacteroidota bacterium]|jgi:hypothetical protein